MAKIFIVRYGNSVLHAVRGNNGDSIYKIEYSSTDESVVNSDIFKMPGTSIEYFEADESKIHIMDSKRKIYSIYLDGNECKTVNVQVIWWTSKKCHSGL